jgi:hypothetical protein
MDSAEASVKNINQAGQRAEASMRPENVPITGREGAEMVLRAAGAGVGIAAKKENEWHVVVRGNGIPSCEDIDHNSVPKEIFGNCIEKSGDLRFSQ